VARLVVAAARHLGADPRHLRPHLAGHRVPRPRQVEGGAQGERGGESKARKVEEVHLAKSSTRGPLLEEVHLVRHSTRGGGGSQRGGCHEDLSLHPEPGSEASQDVDKKCENAQV